MKFISIPHFLVVFCSAVCLTGCIGASPRVALKTDSHLPQKNEVRLIIPEDEIIVRAQPSNISAALGGGLLAALIDDSVTSARQTKLEEVTNPFYDEISDIDFRGLFGKEFTVAFDKQSVLPNTQFVVTSRSLSKKTMDDLQLKLGQEESLMAIRSWFEFSADTKNVIVISAAYMVEKEKKEASYRNMFFYLSKPANISNESSALAYWGANKGEMLKKVYSDSASKIAKMLVEDLKAPSIELIKTKFSDKDKTKVTVPYFNQRFLFTPMNGVVNLSEDGFVVDSDDTHKLIRGESGTLYWIEK